MTREFNYIDIINKCMNKRDMARYKDRYFDRDIDKYVWVLGIDVFKVLEYGTTGSLVIFHLHNPENNLYRLMGIDIQIDYTHKDTIKLFKEV